MSNIERKSADAGPWTLKGQGLGLWPKVVEGPGFEDEERIEVVRADQHRGAVQALAELKEAHEAEGHTVRGLIGQRLRRAITEAEHIIAGQ